jgi:hypothetical protein
MEPKDVMRTLRAQGYAVVLVSPDALEGVDPSEAEDAAWAAIDAAIERRRELEEDPPEPEFPEPTGKLLRDYTTDDFNPKMKHWSDK